MVGLMIGTGEGYLVGLSLGFTLGSPLKSPNHGAELPGMLLVATLRLWFGSELVRCSCCCHHLTDERKANFWGLGIYCITTSGDLITYNKNSVRY